MKALIHVSALSILLLCIACGSGADNPASGSAGAEPAVETGGESNLLQEVTDRPTLPLQPLSLSGDRYAEEIARQEMERAYSESGEFIDPRRVIQLLQEEEQQESEQNQEQEAETSWRISYLIHNQARQLMEEGKVADAAQKWLEMPTDQRVFTLSVGVHCDVGNLEESYTALQSLRLPVFVLPETVNGKPCYRLCAGVFATKESASEWVGPIREQLSGSYPFSMAFNKSGG
jgi:septal ring-binding cell division protein DamX